MPVSVRAKEHGQIRPLPLVSIGSLVHYVVLQAVPISLRIVANLRGSLSVSLIYSRHVLSDWKFSFFECLVHTLDALVFFTLLSFALLDTGLGSLLSCGRTGCY